MVHEGYGQTPYYIYRIVPNRRALPNRRPPPFLDVKQSMKMYLSDAKNAAE